MTQAQAPEGNVHLEEVSGHGHDPQVLGGERELSGQGIEDPVGHRPVLPGSPSSPTSCAERPTVVEQGLGLQHRPHDGCPA
jgi:hypothetical protein